MEDRLKCELIFQRVYALIRQDWQLHIQVLADERNIFHIKILFADFGMENLILPLIIARVIIYVFGSLTVVGLQIKNAQ